MYTNISTNIKKSIMHIVKHHISIQEIRELLIEFIEYQSKKDFLFGELLVLHYDLHKGAKTDEIYTIAACVELIILSFDILDDFEDEDADHSPWMNTPNVSLNITTNLLYLSLDLIRKSNFEHKEKGVSILLEYALQSINGQYKDLLGSCKTEKDYIEMTLEKSGSLVTLACLLGTVLATGIPSESVKKYSAYIGLIGQINNDIQDVQVDLNGKNDLVHYKYTLPIIYLLNNQDIHIIRDYYHHKITREELVENQDFIFQKIEETGAILYAEVLKKIYQNKAAKEIQSTYSQNSDSIKLLNYIY